MKHTGAICGIYSELRYTGGVIYDITRSTINWYKKSISQCGRCRRVDERLQPPDAHGPYSWQSRWTQGSCRSCAAWSCRSDRSNIRPNNNIMELIFTKITCRRYICHFHICTFRRYGEGDRVARNAILGLYLFNNSSRAIIIVSADN